MGKEKTRMYGHCPKCGSLVKRPAPADIGVCMCHNPPTEVALYSYREFRRKLAIAHGLGRR